MQDLPWRFRRAKCLGIRRLLLASLLIGFVLLGVSLANEADGILSEKTLRFSRIAENPQPLFEELMPEETGMADFENNFGSPHIWGKHWRTYLFGAIGTGVAIGDVDSDGRPDVFVVSKNEESRLYLNKGDYRFEDATESSGIDENVTSEWDKNETPGGGAAFADINNDGHLDLYLCYLGGPNQLWINDGKGHFIERAAEWGVDVSDASVMGYFADYDRDGLLDLYLATNLLQEGDVYPGPRRDLLFRNTGDRFVETTREAGISGEGHAHSAVWWDFNADGNMDLYVANDFAGKDKLYKNQGDGTFVDVIATAASRIPYYSMGADFGDINGDGLEDFWVADMSPSSRSRYKRTLESHRHVYEGGQGAAPHQYMQNVLLLNLTGERFADVAALAGLHRTDWTWAARLADMDNDGMLDAFATNGMLRNFNDGDLGMRLAGRHTQVQYGQVFGPRPVLKEANLAFSNKGELRFEAIGAQWGLNKMGVSFGAAFADFAGSGSLDWVISNYGEPPSIYRNLESKGSRIMLELRGLESNRYGIGARVKLSAKGRRQVKTLMPQRGYMSSDEPVLHFGLGAAEKIDGLTIFWPSGRIQKLDNLEANRRYVIEERGEMKAPKERARFRFERVMAQFPPKATRQGAGANAFSRQPLLPFDPSRLLGAGASGDLNGDGYADLILGGGTGQETTVLLGGAQCKFTEAWSLDLEEDFPSADAGLSLGDFDGDGFIDLFAVSGGSSLDPGDLGFQDRLYRGDGKGGFTRDFDSALSQSIASTGSVAAGDWNADGVVDIFIGGGSIPGRYPESGESGLWRGGSGGGFENVTAEAAPSLSSMGRVTDSVWAALGEKEFPDLIVLREWGSPQRWRNEEGRLSLDENAFGGEELSGLWTSLAVGDFDGDGYLDVAAGNLGLNAGGSFEPSQGPRHLWWRGDERGVQLIESHEVEGEEWPLVWRDRLKESAAGRRVSRISYTDYAARSLGDVFGDLASQGFESLSLVEMRSGVFWGGSEGRFSFEAFPAFAQSGRIVDLLAADFDGDGLWDLAASFEAPSLAPWTGRVEGGQLGLMMGREDRRFKLELPSVSGLDAQAGSPRELLWDDFDGDGAKELAVVLAEGEPLIFKPSTR